KEAGRPRLVPKHLWRAADRSKTTRPRNCYIRSTNGTSFSSGSCSNISSCPRTVSKSQCARLGTSLQSPETDTGQDIEDDLRLELGGEGASGSSCHGSRSEGTRVHYPRGLTSGAHFTLQP